MASDPLLAALDGVIIRRRRSAMSVSEVMEICQQETVETYHSYELIRAADYLATAALKINQEIRRRYERGVL